MKQILQNFSMTGIIILLGILLTCCSQVNRGSYDLANLPDSYSQVALLLPLHGAYAGPGSAIRDGFLAGYYASLQQGARPITVKLYDTSQAQDIRKVYATAVADGAQIVVGPLTKTNVNLLAQDGDIKVPTIALNYTAAGYQPPSLFFEFGISPLIEATQVAERAYAANLTRAIIIAPDSSWGQNISQAFVRGFQSSGGKIVDSLAYRPNENLRNDIQRLLHVDQSEQRGIALQSALGEKVTFVPQRRKDMDMIFVVAPPQDARMILPLLRFYYANNLPIYSISMIYRGSQNPNYYRDMNGVIFSDIPWIYTSSQPSSLQSKISTLWPQLFQNYIRLYGLGLDAFMLTQDLKQLPNNPTQGLSGKTGLLFLGTNNWIMQKFSWVQFRDGKAVLI